MIVVDNIVIIVISEAIKTPRNCIFIASLVTTAYFARMQDKLTRTQVENWKNKNFSLFVCLWSTTQADSWHETKKNAQE